MMKFDGAKVFFVISLIVCIGLIVFSFNKYSEATTLFGNELFFMTEPIPAEEPIVPSIDINELFGINTFAEYESLDKRNLFSKFTPKKIEPIIPVIHTIQTKVTAKVPTPKPVSEPEPLVEEQKPVYFYRGTMMMEGEKVYIVEEPGIYKTHFLQEGITKGALILVDIARYGITIKDRDGTIYELPIKKE